MRGWMVGAALAISALASGASAQVGGSSYGSGYGGGYGSSYGSSSYDARTGSSYNTTHDADGSAHVQGYNSHTGSTWSQTVEPNGDQSGTDSRGNSWRYNEQSGGYQNSDGHGCAGHGYGRTCW